ncbi:hypothetical protein [Nocardioides sediminis]|uniref:hypothetical protein n=1 Tax=Nocardioides sediminis TaxID=433648 RepID=UPI000D30E78A|nr:hypothetical protein [Nocardioides sediminis]
MTDTKWAEEIERSFGSGPTLPPTATYVASGRAAVRRRRIAAGAASTFAAALVIGGIGWSVMSGDARPDAGQVATDPTPTAAESPTEEATPSTRATPTVAPLADSPDDVRVARASEREEMEGSAAVTVLGDGTLIRRPGWTVERLEVQQSTDRMRMWGIATSRDDGAEGEWILLTWESRGTSSATWNPPGQRFATFDEWLAVTLDEQLGEPGKPIAVVRDGALVVTARAITILQEVPAPAQAAAYGPVEDQVAVRLRLADGTELFGRVDPAGITTVDPAVLETPTMAAFLRHLEAQGASGEGVR